MPKLLVTLPDDGVEVACDLDAAVVTVGRLDENTLPIDDPSVSSHHAQLTLQGSGAYLLRDLGSTNGTRVNGLRITEATLHPGDQVRFGRVEAVFEASADAPAPDPDDGDADGQVPDLAVATAAGKLAPVPAATAPTAAVAGWSHRPRRLHQRRPVPKTGEDPGPRRPGHDGLRPGGAPAFPGGAVLRFPPPAPRRLAVLSRA